MQRLDVATSDAVARLASTAASAFDVLPPAGRAVALGCVARGMLAAVGREDEPAVRPVLAALAAGDQARAAARWVGAQRALQRSGAIGAVPRGSRYGLVIDPEALLLVDVGRVVRAQPNARAYQGCLGNVLVDAARHLVAAGASDARDVHLWLASCAQAALVACWPVADADPAWRVRAIQVATSFVAGWNAARVAGLRAIVGAVDAALPPVERNSALWRAAYDIAASATEASAAQRPFDGLVRDARATVVNGASGNVPMSPDVERELFFILTIDRLVAVDAGYYATGMRQAASLAATAAGEPVGDLFWNAVPDPAPPTYFAALNRMVGYLQPYRPDMLDAVGTRARPNPGAPSRRARRR